MRKRALISGLTLLAVLAFGSMTSYAGQWIPEGQEAVKWWYKNDDGSWTANDWQKIDGQWYYFGADGYMCSGWQKINGQWYWLDEVGGHMHTSGSWEGGYIGTDGGLVSYDMEPAEDSMVYWKDSQVFNGNLKWKADWMKAMLSNFESGNAANPFYYTLPANWEQECPKGLLDKVVQTAVDYSFGWDGSIVRFNWDVDDNHVFWVKYEHVGSIWE